MVLMCYFQHTAKPGSYTWKHNRPPPSSRRPNHFDMHDMLDMLSEVDLQSGEFYSIMRDSEFFDGMDPFEMMAISDSLASGSGGPCLNPFDSDEDGEGSEIFRMAALSEALSSGVDYFGPEDFDDIDPMEAALISMMIHSQMEEDFEEDEDEEDGYTDEDYY